MKHFVVSPRLHINPIIPNTRALDAQRKIIGTVGHEAIIHDMFSGIRERWIKGDGKGARFIDGKLYIPFGEIRKEHSV